MLLQGGEEGLLVGTHIVAGGREGEPAPLIDFGDFKGFAGVGRPLDFAGVTDESGGVAVSCKGPGGDDFAARLADRAEGEERGGGGEAGFLLELALGGVEGIFVVVVLAFRDCPGAFIAGRPEGAAGMDEEDLKALLDLPVHQETCAALGHGWRQAT